MLTLVVVIHIIASIGLIFVVLLQTGKGAEMGAVFGGSSSTIFGSSGAGNFLTRLTTGMAVVFMITSLTLGYSTGKRPSASLFDSSRPTATPPVAQQPGPAQPKQAGPATAPQPQAQPAPPQPQKPATP